MHRQEVAVTPQEALITPNAGISIPLNGFKLMDIIKQYPFLHPESPLSEVSSTMQPMLFIVLAIKILKVYVADANSFRFQVTEQDCRILFYTQEQSWVPPLFSIRVHVPTDIARMEDTDAVSYLEPKPKDWRTVPNDHIDILFDHWFKGNVDQKFTSQLPQFLSNGLARYLIKVKGNESKALQAFAKWCRGLLPAKMKPANMPYIERVSLALRRAAYLLEPTGIRQLMHIGANPNAVGNSGISALGNVMHAFFEIYHQEAFFRQFVVSNKRTIPLLAVREVLSMARLGIELEISFDKPDANAMFLVLGKIKKLYRSLSKSSTGEVQEAHKQMYKTTRELEMIIMKRVNLQKQIDSTHKAVAVLTRATASLPANTAHPHPCSIFKRMPRIVGAQTVAVNTLTSLLTLLSLQQSFRALREVHAIESGASGKSRDVQTAYQNLLAGLFLKTVHKSASRIIGCNVSPFLIGAKQSRLSVLEDLVYKGSGDENTGAAPRPGAA